MHSESRREPIEDVVRATIEGNRPKVRDWLAAKPGSWGFLAGKVVIAYRQGLGRSLTDLERRQVWHLLWACLVELRRMSSPNTSDEDLT